MSNRSNETQAFRVSGGKVWRPRKSMFDNKFGLFLYNASALLLLVSVVSSLFVIVLGFIQSKNSQVQQEDFFTKFTLYNNGWEMPTIVIILTIFAATSLFLSSFKFGWSQPPAYGISIIATMGLCLFFALPSVFALDADMQALKSWLEEKQGLSLLVDEGPIALDDTLIMKDKDEKIYLVTFKVEDNKVFIADQIQQ